MTDLDARVRHEYTGHEGTIVELDAKYRARVHWDGKDHRADWIPRRLLIVLSPSKRQAPG